MGDDELLGFIKKSRERGRADDQIVQQLLSVGWRKEKVESAFAELREQKMAEKRDSPPPPPAQMPLQQTSATLQQPPQWQQPTAQAALQQPQPSTASLPIIPKLAPTSQPQPQAQSSSQPIDLAQKKSPFSFLNPFAKKSPDQPPADSYSESPQQPAQGGLQQPMPQQSMAPAQQMPTPERQHAPIELNAQQQGGFTTKKLAMYAIVVVLGVALAVGIYYFLIMPAMLPASTREETRAPAPKQNGSQEQGQSQNRTAEKQRATEAPQQQNGTQGKLEVPTPLPLPGGQQAAQEEPPVPEPQVAQNQSTPPQGESQSPPMQGANITTTIPVEFVEAPANNSSEQSFARTRRYSSSHPYGLGKFCKMEGGSFYRAHYKEYYGGECISEKPQDGFLSGAAMLSTCSDVPCCVPRQLNEFSTGYDYLECGFEE